MANTANNQRGAQGGWANGQLPVAMQQQMAAQTSNGQYGRGAPVR